MARFKIFPSSQLHNSLHRPNPIPNIFGPPSPGFRESKEDLIVPKFRDRIEIKWNMVKEIKHYQDPFAHYNKNINQK